MLNSVPTGMSRVDSMRKPPSLAFTTIAPRKQESPEYSYSRGKSTEVLGYLLFSPLLSDPSMVSWSLTKFRLNLHCLLLETDPALT